VGMGTCPGTEQHQSSPPLRLSLDKSNLLVC
jgi:hypothetical protein